MRSIRIALSIILLDQATKILVLKTMYRGQSIPLLGDWLRLTYTENPGMAFGLSFGPPAMITIFSIAATGLILYYLIKVGRLYTPYRVSLSMVLGGAFGNIIDRVFYGKILYDDPMFLGRVVDFIHVNMWRGHIPESIPLIGGKYIALFPIWNVADMAIVLGVVGIIAFQRQFHAKMEAIELAAAEPAPEDAALTDAALTDAAPSAVKPPASDDSDPSASTAAP